MRLLLAAAALAALATARTAAADCGGGHTHISPPDGAHVPVDPHIYLFVPHGVWAQRDEWLRIEQGGKGVPFRATVLADVPAWQVVRLDITTDVARPLTISYAPADYWDRGEATYTVDHAPAADRATLIAAEHVVDRWTCSYTDAIALDVTGTAVAYRLEWARTADELARAPRGRAWLWPESDPVLRDAVDGEALASPDRLMIGHLSCRGFTIPEGALAEPRATRLVALFADGHEATIDTGGLQLADGTVRLPEHGLLTTARPAPPPPILIAVSEPGPALAAAAAGAFGALAIMLALSSRRRRSALGTLGL
jgi:hypothetical protein